MQIIFSPTHDLSSFFPFVHWIAQFFFIFLFVFLWFLTFFLIDFDGYYIVRTDDGRPRPKYIFNKYGRNNYFFNLQRFGPSASPNFKYKYTVKWTYCIRTELFLPFVRILWNRTLCGISDIRSTSLQRNKIIQY